MASTVEIDPNGDILLQFPTTNNELRVSSSVLSLISPVFSVMLNGCMSEAVAFQAHRAQVTGRPFVIELPEDDGHAFIVLANIAHYRAHLVPSRPTPQQLLDFSILADKYGCAKVFAPYGTIWLRRSITDVEANISSTADIKLGEHQALMSKLSHLILFAYVMDAPEEFAAISWLIMLHHDQSSRSESRGFDLPIPTGHNLARHDLRSTYLMTSCDLWHLFD